MLEQQTLALEAHVQHSRGCQQKAFQRPPLDTVSILQTDLRHALQLVPGNIRVVTETREDSRSP